MRRLAFVHDGPIFLDESGGYHEYAYPSLLERYSYIADEITFLIRVKQIADGSKFTALPEEVNVVAVPDFKSPKLYFENLNKAETIIEQCVLNNDYFVLRLQSSIAEIAFKFIKKHNKPFIVECVGDPWDSYWNHSLLGKFIAPLSLAKTRMIIRQSGFVYYVTSDYLQKRLPPKRGACTVSCSNVVLDELDDAVLEARLNKIERFSKTHIVIGTAAAIDTRYKGQEYVIRALPLLLKKGYTVEYRLAGGKNRDAEDTYLRDIALRCGVDGNVTFLGAVPAVKMPDFYDGLDIYIQPSKQEGLPRAVIEAMARACPCIGSDIAGIPELVQPNLLFKAGSAHEIVDAIERALDADLQTVAYENFVTARSYEAKILAERRERFYDVFLASLEDEHCLIRAN